MYRYLFVILVLSLCAGCSVTQTKEEAWVSLFNGKDLKGWTAKIHHYKTGDNYGNTFRVKDGVIQVRYDQYQAAFNERYGHLYYDIPYANYHLKLAYRFVGKWEATAPSYTLLNSGLMFHSQDPKTMPKEQDWPISVEMQFLGGIEEGVARPTGNMCSPGTEVVFEGKMDPRHCIASSSDTYYGEQWVQAELIVYGDSLITHKINGRTVLQYSKPSIGGGVANRFDPQFKINGSPLKEGFIALQSEGQPIDFKNIELKVLKP